MNIFLVEDDDLDAEIFERRARKTGYEITLTRARDGIEALEMLQGEAGGGAPERPYLILLDINMPHMDGHEFLAALRADADLRDSSVFVFTTSDADSDVSSAYANNANGYIVKPSGLAGLSRVIQMLREYWEVCEHPVRKAEPRGAPAPVAACN